VISKKTIAVFFWLMIVSPPCFAISTYMGLQPGLSTRSEVEKVLGQPVQSINPTLFEYPLASGLGKIYVEFRAKDFVVDRIERRFDRPISRSALIRSLNLPENPEETGTNKDGKLMEYFGDIKTVALTYASAQTSSGIVSVGYYSMELFERSLDKARNPQVQFDPSACRDLYFWAQGEREVAKRSKNVGRHQAILEILILSQRGECEKARSLVTGYKEHYR
jgi:hypothetical protein